jgi:4-amino-4-deoxy-L-arabinose transferase-like glycosyltransferase
LAGSRYIAVRRPNGIYLLGGLVLLMHYYFLMSSFLHQSHLTDDSVQYLTIAENMSTRGIFSQSFDEPYVEDVQRTPGYPVFLLALGSFVPLVLVVQHLLVLWTGYLIYRLLHRYVRKRVARTGAFIYLFQPYPMIFASMVLSETLFIFLLVAALSFYLRWYDRVKFMDLVYALIFLCLAMYVRPLGYPLLWAAGALALLKLFFRRRWQMIPGLAVVLILPALLIGPWMYRNKKITGRYMVSSMGSMGLLHGRMGGLEAYRQGLPVDEHHFYMTGDSIAGLEIGVPAIREYYGANQTHETEIFNPAVKRLTFRFYLEHPVDAVKFQVKNVGAMLSGIGLGWSRSLTHSRTASWISAALQLFFNLVMFAGLLVSLYWIRRWRPQHWIPAIGIGLVLLASAAGWADGRYRVVIDPLFIVFVADSLERRLRLREFEQELKEEI